MKILKYGAVLIILMSLWGCGKGNGSAPTAAGIDPATGKHPVGMAVAVSGGAHVDAFFANPEFCKQCHGEPTAPLEAAKETVSKVSCSTVSRSGISCHAGAWPHGNGYAAFNLHGKTAKSAATGFNGMAVCKNCHGPDYTGISGLGVNCIACHNGVDGNNAPHAAHWLSGVNVNGVVHSTTDQSNASACAQCHLGGKLSPDAPPSPAPPAGTVPGCFNGTLCHFEVGHVLIFPGSVHGSQAGAAPFSSCKVCHDTTTAGGTYTAGLKPLCSSCHTDVAHFNATPGCGDCHGDKVLNDGKPNGAAFPNNSGAHLVHVSFPNVTCTVCHNGAGSGTSNHGLSGNSPLPKAATVSVLATYQAETGGAPQINTGTKKCANISCHGGQATPAWGTNGNYPFLNNDYINNNFCTNCHQQRDPSVPSSLQFNSYFSGFDADPLGLHNFHVASANPAITCTDCHDPAALTSAGPNHFVGLNNPAMPRAPFTIRASFNYTVNANGTTTCISPPNASQGQVSAVSGSQCHGNLGFPVTQRWK